MKLRFKQINNEKEWTSPKIVSNSLELLDKELQKAKNIKSVFMCLTTDPFMYKQDEVIDTSLKIIQKLNSFNIPVTILTKGILPYEKISDICGHEINSYGISLSSLDEEFRECYEPFASPIKNRLAALKHLSSNYLKTWVCIEPYPTPNIYDQAILDLLEDISFTDEILFGRWNYNKEISSEKGYKEFYKHTEQVVELFCRSNVIKLRIKITPSSVKEIL